MAMAVGRGYPGRNCSILCICFWDFQVWTRFGEKRLEKRRLAYADGRKRPGNLVVQ